MQPDFDGFFCETDGVHHYDEYGLKDLTDEPPEIRQIHGDMILFVEQWLRDWKEPKA